MDDVLGNAGGDASVWLGELTRSCVMSAGHPASWATLVGALGHFHGLHSLNVLLVCAQRAPAPPVTVGSVVQWQIAGVDADVAGLAPVWVWRPSVLAAGWSSGSLSGDDAMMPVLVSERPAEGPAGQRFTSSVAVLAGLWDVPAEGNDSVAAVCRQALRLEGRAIGDSTLVGSVVAAVRSAHGLSWMSSAVPWGDPIANAERVRAAAGLVLSGLASTHSAGGLPVRIPDQRQAAGGPDLAGGPPVRIPGQRADPAVVACGGER